MSDSGSGTLARVPSVPAILEAGPVRREIFPFLQATEWIPSSDVGDPEPEAVTDRETEAPPAGEAACDEAADGSHRNGAGPSDPTAAARDAETGLPVAGVDFHEPETAPAGTDIVFEHGLLASVHRAARRRGETIGVFLGTPCECPWTRRSWIRVTGARPGAPEPEEPAAGGGTAADGLRERLSPAIAACEGTERVVGWYRARPLAGTGDGAALGLALEERELHAAHFPEAWQFCILFRSDTPRGELGLFRRGADGSVEGDRPAPLYELAPAAGLLRRRPLQARNYRPAARRRAVGAWPRARAAVRWRWPAAAAAAVVILGAAVGLGLGRELPPDMQPAVESAGADFASPVAPGEALAALEDRAAALRALIAASGGEAEAGACAGVDDARAALGGAYLGVRRALAGSPEEGPTLATADGIVERLEAEVAESGCASGRPPDVTAGAGGAAESAR